MRHAVAWLLALPLVLAATSAAHALDYRLVVPNAGARATLLAATGHGAGDWLPLLLATSISLTIIALATSGTGAPRIGPFLAAPSLVFVLQEHLERLLHDGSFPWHLVTDPTFAPGLALTIPFGFAAYFAARAILYAARAAAQVLEPIRFSSFTEALPLAPASATVLLVPVLASQRATRGPPAVR
jgi:hypothetical protein